MKWGMNIKLGDIERDIAFISKCNDAGIKFVKLIAHDVSSCAKVLDKIKELDMKAYVSVSAFDQKAPDWKALRSRYTAFCFDIDADACLGVALPQNAHAITRAGARSIGGIRRDEVSANLNLLSIIIKKAGIDVVLPVTLDEIQGAVWDKVDFDVYDIDNMMSPVVNRATETILANTLKGVRRRYWFGRAGQLGGNVMPVQTGRMLRRLRQCSEGVEYAFLWSEKADDRFHWSVNGEFMIDMVKGEVKESIMTSKMVKSSYKDNELK